MYVRLITFHVRPGTTTAHATAVYDALLAQMKDYPGFRGLSVFLNEDAAQAVSLSYWDDCACAVEAGAKSLPALMEQVRGLVDRAPEISGYEVARQEFVQGSGASGGAR